MPARLSRAAGRAAEMAGKALRTLPGVGALGCSFAGAWLTWGLGVGLLVVGGLLAIEAVT